VKWWHDAGDSSTKLCCPPAKQSAQRLFCQQGECLQFARLHGMQPIMSMHGAVTNIFDQR
jgi:hypothetical protein